MRLTTAASVVLIAPFDGGLATNGTGFVVGRSGEDALVLTCSHVIGHDHTAKVRVNGREPSRIESAFSIGLDIALLTVPGLSGPKLEIGGLEVTDEVYSYFGFSKLYADDYMRTRSDVKFTRVLDLQHAQARQGYLAYEVTAIGNASIQPGHSGSPVIVDGRASAIVSHRLGDGGRGLALALASALRQWPPTQALVGIATEGAELGAERQGEPERRARTPPRFPSPPPPTTKDPEDSNAERFGGSEKDGFRLRGVLKNASTRRSFFTCDLVVDRVDGAELTADAARFFLHDTFDPSVYTVKRRREAQEIRLEDITAYGVFTAGAQVRHGTRFTTLGYDLKKLPGLPPEFKTL